MMAAPAILFLPGLLCDDTVWAHQVAGLATLAPTAVADLSCDDTIAAMAERAAATAPDRFVIVALSMGGYVAFELWRRWPERIAGLALFATSAAPDTPARAAERRAGLDSLALGRFAGVTRRLLPKLVHPKFVDGMVGASVQTMAKSLGGDAYIRQQRAILGRIDSRPTLATIDVPTMVAVGREDLLTPVSEARAIHTGIAGSCLQIIEECGHLPPLEQPDRTSHLLLQWLSANFQSTVR